MSPRHDPPFGLYHRRLLCAFHGFLASVQNRYHFVSSFSSVCFRCVFFCHSVPFATYPPTFQRAFLDDRAPSCPWPDLLSLHDQTFHLSRRLPATRLYPRLQHRLASSVTIHLPCVSLWKHRRSVFCTFLPVNPLLLPLFFFGIQSPRVFASSLSFVLRTILSWIPIRPRMRTAPFER